MNDMQTVLIVEDERVNRMILHKILKDSFHVIEAENGAVAWRLLSGRRSEISAVVLDLTMPVMDGHELLTELREAHMTDLPVIVATGSANRNTEGKALEEGAWDFVTKPYDAKVLLPRLKNAIARSQVPAFERMQYLAEHDALTGLSNRSKMFADTRRMIDAHPGQQFVFLRFDIDHFALYNTSFGEQEGDRLLKHLAGLIQSTATEQPFFTCGRIAADIFCFCGPLRDNVELLCRRLNQTSEALAAYRQDYRLELSVGICVIDDASLSVEECFYRATLATQKCKNQVNATYAFYDAAVGEQLLEEITIANEMQSALDERQFVVWLQPKFMLPQENVCGAEALVRWQHPTRGMIYPGAFIPLFEKNGFISKLDYYVWEETCRLLRDWQRAGLTVFPVSVNISRVSLYNPNLCEMMIELVAKYGIPPSLLQLEFTESAYMSNPDLMEETLDSLHDAGFTILMDDFGSGYSSLNTLKRIRVDVLKVDMKFLPVKDETERGEIILSSIIKMANWLGMTVVVEGVETRRQRDFLEGAGCDSIQGYYYSKPIPAPDYEAKYLIPATSDARDSAIGKSCAIAPLHNMTILVIDDSETDRAVLMENFRELYHLHMCDSAEAGLAYLKTNAAKVRLILVGNIMPGMSGMEFLRFCQQDSTLSAIPKIMITANNTVQDQVAALTEGAYDYITKPFVREIFAARVNHVMEISRKSSLFDSVEQEYGKKTELDASTQLLNKMAFRSLASRILEYLPDDSEALMLLDIDDFKQINERYGHLAGDSVLRCVASELNSAFRRTDIMGRFGGDEFMVMMTKLPNLEIAKRKAAEVIRDFTISCSRGLHIEASMSIGIAFSQPGDTLDTLISRADAALREAKRGGKGRAVVFGEKVPPILDDDKPIVLVCGQNQQLLPSIALAYGERVSFAGVASYAELVKAFAMYANRIRAVCLDIEDNVEGGSDEFCRFIRDQGGTRRIQLIAIYREGNMEQLHEAMRLEAQDIISLPPQIDVIQRRLSRILIDLREANDARQD